MPQSLSPKPLAKLRVMLPEAKQNWKSSTPPGMFPME